MKVKTLRKHVNSYGPQPTKNVGRHYEVTDLQAQNLIAEGLVEEVTTKSDGEDQD